MNRFAVSLLVFVGGLAAGSCGGGGSSSPMSATAPTRVTSGPADVVVTILGQDGSMSFSPNPVSVRVGQAIAWKNGDAIVHQVVQDSGGGGDAGGYGGGGSGGAGFDMGPTSAGAMSPSLSLTATGTLKYHCAIHPTMTGTITITN